jgi:hypothetical protein
MSLSNNPLVVIALLTSVVYLYMLEEFRMPSLKEKAVNDMLGPQDVAPSHFRSAVRAEYLDRKFSQKWSGRDWRANYLASPFH